MIGVDRAHVLVAIGWLLVGMLFGYWMGASGHLEFRPVHITMLLPGFVTIAIFGLVYRLWSDMKGARMAWVQFWLTSLASVGLVAGSFQTVETGSVVIPAVASTVAIIGAAILAWIFLNAKPA
jgi:hypothetical protein